MQPFLFVQPNDTSKANAQKCTFYYIHNLRMHSTAVMLYVLTPTFLAELSDDDCLSAPDLSDFYKITGPEIK